MKKIAGIIRELLSVLLVILVLVRVLVAAFKAGAFYKRIYS